MKSTSRENQVVNYIGSYSLGRFLLNQKYFNDIPGVFELLNYGNQGHIFV
jgi:hypothetical protein